ncbi:ergosterol biosynthetic protein 28 homolog isoform 2-T2 [Molossus nigricans]
MVYLRTKLEKTRGCQYCPHTIGSTEMCKATMHLEGSVINSQAGQEALSDLRGVMSRFLNVLRSWLVMVSIIAMGNTLQSFRDHTFLYEKLYTGKPNLVNGLQARTFGIWTLLSSVIRCLCAVDIHNKTLYHITLWTFLLALGHFLSELFVYGTAAPTIGVLAPLMVASLSILGMLVGLRYLEAEPVSRQKKRN